MILYIGMYEQRNCSNVELISTVLSYLQQGNAALWASNQTKEYIAEGKGFPHWQEFQHRLLKQFGEPAAKERALAEIMNLFQGTTSVTTYTMQFRLRLGCVSDTEMGNSMTILYYKKGLNRNIRDELNRILHLEQTLEAHVDAAVTIETDQKKFTRENRLFDKGRYGGGGYRQNSNSYYSPPTSQSTTTTTFTTQARVMSASTCEQHFRDNLCFRCSKPGHRIKDCKQPPTNNNPFRRNNPPPRYSQRAPTQTGQARVLDVEEGEGQEGGPPKDMGEEERTVGEDRGYVRRIGSNTKPREGDFRIVKRPQREYAYGGIGGYQRESDGAKEQWITTTDVDGGRMGVRDGLSGSTPSGRHQEVQGRGNANRQRTQGEGTTPQDGVGRVQSRRGGDRRTLGGTNAQGALGGTITGGVGTYGRDPVRGTSTSPIPMGGDRGTAMGTPVLELNAVCKSLQKLAKNVCDGTRRIDGQHRRCTTRREPFLVSLSPSTCVRIRTNQQEKELSLTFTGALTHDGKIVETPVLVDSGATHCFIHNRLVQRHHWKTYPPS